MYHLTTHFEHALLRVVDNTGVVCAVRWYPASASTIAEVVDHVEKFIQPTKLTILLRVDWPGGQTDHFFWNEAIREFDLL